MSIFVNNLNNEIKTGKGIARWTVLLTTLILLLLMLPTFAFAASGKDDVKYDSMTIRIMPEYDDPRVLTIFEPVISNNISLPAKAKYLIPNKHPGFKIGMACEVPSGQGHACKPYKIIDAGDYKELSYDAEKTRNLFMEYYWNPFKGASGDERKFDYIFKTPYPIKQLDIYFQEPLRASDYRIEPTSQNISSDNDGYKWYSYSFSDVKPDQIIKFNVSYNSGGTSKRVSNEKAQELDQLGISYQRSAALSPFQIILLTLFVLIAVGAMIFYWRSQSNKSTSRTKWRKNPNKRSKKAHFTKAETSRYCSNCGNVLKEGSHFCSVCGSELD